MPSAPADRPVSRARRPLPSVSVVIPVRDSAGLPPMLRSLAWGVRRVADEVIMVTAGPVQDAAVLAACPEALLVRPARPGLGNALACGFAAATGDVVVALDAGGATDPGELPRYVDALVAGADVALGSRYREGGQDLTAGRFRRRLNLMLIWLVNVLFRVHRTDPGFGYTALWRDAVDRLGLPDPSPAAPAAWGDGPEIQAIITVRTATRGLVVAEVPGVAYPRMRRAARADRTTLGQWLRVCAAEFRGRPGRPARHAVFPSAGTSTAVPSPGTSTAPMAAPAPRRPGPGAQPGADRRTLPGRRVTASDRRVDASDRRVDAAAPPATPAAGRTSAAGPEIRSAGSDRSGAAEATGRRRPGRDALGEPPHRGRGLADLGPADISAPLDRVTGSASPAAVPAGAEIPPLPPAVEPRREVGAKRRRLEAYRQRPELRLIEGDGTASGRTRSERLRAVPQE